MNERTLGGKYRLTDQIGAKDEVRTYKAVDDRGAVHAVEVLDVPPGEDIDRLDRWAETMLTLDHPDLARIHTYGAEGVSFYVVREYVVGSNLKTLLAGGPMQPKRAARYAIQVCEALHAANRIGLVHGDLRPQNLVVTEDDRVKVTEFQMPPRPGRFTSRTSRIPEFWHYASPEEIRGLELRPASDVYSLGVILYEMVTGRVPFDGTTVDEVQGKHLIEPPPPVHDSGARVPPALEAVIMRALAKDPADRYQLFDDMRADLLTVLEPKTGLVPATGSSAVQVAPAPGSAVEAAPTAVRGGAVEVAPAAVPAAVPGYGPITVMPAVRRRVWPWILLAALLAVALAVALIAQFLLAPVGVPTLTGLTRAEAVTAITAAGLTVGRISNQPAPTPSIGSVVVQNPRAQIRVRRGTAVDIAVGAARSIATPQLTGQTQQEAIATLARAGLTVGAITFRTTSTVPEGTVVAQSPPVAQVLTPDSPVALTVAHAPVPPATVIMPSAVGMERDDAISLLRGTGLTVNRTREFSDSFAAGVVIRQVPDAGTTIDKGSAVTIVVSSGRLLVTVPAVVGLDRPDAVAAVTRLGLDVFVSFEDTRSALRGKVLRQYPDPGLSISPATEVRLIVGD